MAVDVLPGNLRPFPPRDAVKDILISIDQNVFGTIRLVLYAILNAASTRNRLRERVAVQPFGLRQHIIPLSTKQPGFHFTDPVENASGKTRFFCR